MHRCAQCVTTHTEQLITFASHEHAWLKIAHFCVPKQLSSTCRVSFIAALDIDHKHKISLTYFIYLSDVLSLSPKSFGARSIFTLRRSAAEWRINSNPISHHLASCFLKKKTFVPHQKSFLYHQKFLVSRKKHTFPARCMVEAPWLHADSELAGMSPAASAQS